MICDNNLLPWNAFHFEKYHQFTSTIHCVSDYQCSSGPCISNSSVWDGWNNCSDGADEAGCGKGQLQFLSCTFDFNINNSLMIQISFYGVWIPL